MQRVVQVLTILTLLALAPALAQGSQPSFKPTSSTLVLPVGQELSDAELSQIEGKWVNFLIDPNSGKPSTPLFRTAPPEGARRGRAPST